MNRYIKPSALNILGIPQRASTSTRSSNVQDESTPRQSLWGRIKSGAKKVFGLIKQAVTYVKTEIVPIVIAVVAVTNACANYQRYAGKSRDSACCA